MLTRVAYALFILLGIVPIGGKTPTSPEWNPVVESIATPAASPSAQPQLSSSDRGVILSWLEHEGAKTTLKYSERVPSGWSSPSVVAFGSDWFVNWADVPAVVRLEGERLAAVWFQRSGPDTYAYDVRLAYSTDNGRTWSSPFSPHHDGTKTEHGFASLFPLANGGLGVAWLDGRATAGSGGHEAHATRDDRGGMSLWFAAFDSSWRQESEMSVDERVCDCCPTTVALTSEGPIVAYRDRAADETRDIHVSRLVDGRWTAPNPVHDDGWRIAACPVNGPKLVARGRDVAAAWFTGKGDEGHAYVAFSSDAGRTFGSPVRLDDTATLGRVDIGLLPDGSALASWIELTGTRAELRVRRVDRLGGRSAGTIVTALEGNRAAGYPRLAMHGTEAVFAWTETGTAQSRVKTARILVPQAATPDSHAMVAASAPRLR